MSMGSRYCTASPLQLVSVGVRNTGLVCVDVGLDNVARQVVVTSNQFVLTETECNHGSPLWHMHAAHQSLPAWFCSCWHIQLCCLLAFALAGNTFTLLRVTLHGLTHVFFCFAPTLPSCLSKHSRVTLGLLVIF